MLNKSIPVIVPLILLAIAVSNQSASAQTKTDELFRLIATIGNHKEKTSSISFGDLDGDGDQGLVVVERQLLHDEELFRHLSAHRPDQDDAAQQPG